MDLKVGLQKLEEVAVNDSEAARNLALLFDDGSFTELDKFVKNDDDKCDVITAYGMIDGITAFAFAGNSGKDGAMGRVSAAKICKVYEMAKKVGAPVIGIYNSDGAHIEEGIEAMEAYASISAAAAAISGVVPQISVISGNCVGSAAMLASMADIVLMKKDASFYVTAGSILNNKEIGTSHIAAENGTAAYIYEEDTEAFDKVAEIITYLPSNNLSAPGFAEYVPSSVALEGNDAENVIGAVCDDNSFCELYKEYALGVKVGFARIGGMAVAVVATNTDGEKLAAEDCKKIARFVRFADAFSIPVVTFVNANGVLGNEEDELSGGVKSASQLMHAYMEATTVKISVVTGAAVGAAYMALASRASGVDSVFAWPNAYVSNLEPKTYVEFLCKDKLAEGKTREEIAEEYISGEASAFAAAEKGFMEDIIAPQFTSAKITMALDMLSGKRVSTISKKHSNIQL